MNCCSHDEAESYNRNIVWNLQERDADTGHNLRLFDTIISQVSVQHNKITPTGCPDFVKILFNMWALKALLHDTDKKSTIDYGHIAIL